MKIGYACILRGKNLRTNRSLILRNFNEKKWMNLVNENLDDLEEILKYNFSNNIFMFRISSDILPFASHHIMKIDWKKLLKTKFSHISKYIKGTGMRVSMHPGQYTVLNSPREEIVKNSISELKYHADFLDALEVDFSCKIILHIGGVYGNKENAIQRFIDNFEILPENVKKRLVIENDEKNYSIEDILKICNVIKIPAIFDNLHDECFYNEKRDVKKIMSSVNQTWYKEDGNQKIHYSQQMIKNREGSHSRSIEIESFLHYYNQIKDFNPDIIIEVKDKDISAIKCKLSIDESNGIFDKGKFYTQWENYKYYLMAKGKIFSEFPEKIFGNDLSFSKLYKYTDKNIYSEYDEKGLLDAAKEIWNLAAKKLTIREKNRFKKLINENNNHKKLIDFLYRISLKYGIDKIHNSYLFAYNF